ncbi:MAG TPA: hypothetical protein VLZ74_07245 [Methylocella sp.]|nr:hypothetical protein [Methylocella sp.]
MKGPGLIEQPTIFAAIVAAAATIGVAVAGAFGGMVSSYYQHQTSVAQLKANLLLDIVQKDDTQRREYTRRLISSGVLEDNDGTICRALVSQGTGECPIKVGTPN